MGLTNFPEVLMISPGASSRGAGTSTGEEGAAMEKGVDTPMSTPSAAATRAGWKYNRIIMMEKIVIYLNYITILKNKMQVVYCLY